MSDGARRGIRSVQTGLVVNGVLALTKLVAGLLGNSYALVADAVESTTDIFSSLIVWSGLRIASRAADDEYPFGYGKAEPLAAAVVSLMLLGAAAGRRVFTVGTAVGSTAVKADAWHHRSDAITSALRVLSLSIHCPFRTIPG